MQNFISFVLLTVQISKILSALTRKRLFVSFFSKAKQKIYYLFVSKVFYQTILCFENSVI
jgi:hypothetical protein